MPIPLRVAVDIAAPPDKIYPYLSDLTRHDEWSKADIDIKPVGDGTFVSHTHFMRKPVEATLSTVTDEAPKHYVFDVKEPKNTTQHEFNLTAKDGGTRLERVMYIPDGNPVLGLMVKAVIGPLAIKPDMKASLKKLKGIVEAG